MKNIMTTVRTGAAYIRVSTEEQTELSPDAQRRLILDYADKNGITVPVEYIFTENGISGKHAKKRPEFQRMIGLAKSPGHPIDVILVWKFSRFARNQEESIVYKSMLKKDRVEVLSVSEPLVDGPFGTLIERIIEWMDEYYSIRLSGEVLRGMTEKALRGGYQAAPPLGYRAIGGGRPPEIIGDEAALVRLIFQWYSEGMEVSAIARKLNGMGARTKRGGSFENRAVRYILTNPFYIGKIRWTPGASDGEGNTPIIADGSHTSIVPEAVFLEVQKKLNVRYKDMPASTESASVPAASSPRPLSESSHYLSGLFRCPVCGASLSCSHTQYGSFQCWRYAKGLHTGSASLSLRKAEAALLQSLDQITRFSELCIHFPEKCSDQSIRIQLLEKEIKRQKERELRAREAYENGIDSLSEYETHKTRLSEQRCRLEEEFRQITQNESSGQWERNPVSKLHSIRELMTSPEVPPELKGTALRAVLKKIVYQKGSGECHFYYCL